MNKSWIMLGIFLLAIVFIGKPEEPLLELLIFFGMVSILNGLIDKSSELEVEGVARMVQMTQQERGKYDMDTVLNFRIEQTDKEGNIINVLPVEMRGKRIQGYIAEGDRVKVKGKIEDGTMMAKEVFNISTNSKVKVK